MKLMRNGPNITSDIHGRPLCAEGDCENVAAAEMTFDGLSYCTRHGNRIIKHQQQERTELQRYREYQETSFGTVLFDWSDDQLRDRREILTATPRTGTELHLARLDAEEKAIRREIERRRATS